MRSAPHAPRNQILVAILLTGALLAGMAASSEALAGETTSGDGDILELSIEDLLGMEVTSVSKRPQSLHDAAAAIFVLTGDDIRRMGVTTVPDALAHVPGLQVSRLDANKWAITSRGFNGRFSNKLLVLIDGRSVYTTTFSGVYWEVQDLVLEDIERIEIIRGPGSTLWGANAVNGVINIITKHAADTQGRYLTAGTGDHEPGVAALRWGGRLSPHVFARAYGKAFSRGEFPLPDGQDASDDWRQLRAGFRLDANSSLGDVFTLQGDIYTGEINQQTELTSLLPPYLNQVVDDQADVSGGNVLGRWSRSLSPTSEYSFQIYFDSSQRNEAIADQITSQFDYDFQHRFSATGHKIVWGLGYHYTEDTIGGSRTISSKNPTGQHTLYSGFLQDEYSIWENRLSLTLGSKFEHNQFTGLEIQPSARFMWRATERNRLWGAVSRAVHTPLRAEDDIEISLMVLPPDSPTNPAPLPLEILSQGNPDLDSETVLAYELGWRFALDNLSVDVASFYNDYDHLHSTAPGPIEVRYLANPPYLAQPLIFNNNGDASTYGGELALSWQTRNWLRWNIAYSLFVRDDSSSDPRENNQQKEPRNQLGIGLQLSPTRGLNLGAYLRYVDDNLARGIRSREEREIPSFTTLDANLGLQLTRDFRVSLIGLDLLENRHIEYVSESFTLPTEVPRRVHAQVSWSF